MSEDQKNQLPDETVKDSETKLPGDHSSLPLEEDIGSVYQRKGVEDVNLEKDIPDLNSGIGQRLNRKAMVFILLCSGLAVAFLAYAFSFFSSGKKETVEETAREQVVEIPSSPIPAAPVVSAEAAVQQQAQPINMASQPGLPKAPELTVPEVPAIASTPIQSFSDATTSAPAVDNLVASRTGDGSGNFITSEDEKQAASGALGGVDRLKAQKVLNPDFLLIQGTYIRCVLSSRIVSDIPGNASCVVTEPVYSSSGTKLLIPKGSKVLGNYASGSSVGNRIGVIWSRIITPDQVDIRMQSQGTDSMGGAGHPGHYRSHWQSRLGTALLISLIGDGVDYVGQKSMPETVVSTSTSTTITPTETRTARTLERVATEELNRLGMRQPTVTINQGQILNIFVSQDIDFEGVIKN